MQNRVNKLANSFMEESRKSLWTKSRESQKKMQGRNRLSTKGHLLLMWEENGKEKRSKLACSCIARKSIRDIIVHSQLDHHFLYSVIH